MRVTGASSRAGPGLSVSQRVIREEYSLGIVIVVRLSVTKPVLGSRKILFVSQDWSADAVREALGTGAQGYLVKTDARKELLEAVDAVLRGERFVGRRFSGQLSPGKNG
jgi:DNA-binding NarL/FixJ family response regulator